MFSKRRHSKTRRCILLISFVCFPFEYKARITQLRRGSSKRWVYYIRLYYTVYNNRVSNRSLFCTCCCGNREHEALDRRDDESVGSRRKSPGRNQNHGTSLVHTYTCPSRPSGSHWKRSYDIYKGPQVLRICLMSSCPFLYASPTSIKTIKTHTAKRKRNWYTIYLLLLCVYIIPGCIAILIW